MCFACLKWLLVRSKSVKRKSTHRLVHPGSVNNSTYNSSLKPKYTPNSEVTVFMVQVEKSRRNSCHSQPSLDYTHIRRFSEASALHFTKSMEKRPKREVISPDCFRLYKEVSGVLILDHQLRQQTRRSPPLPLKVEDRQNTW